MNQFFGAATFMRDVNVLRQSKTRTHNFSSLARVSRQSVLPRRSLEKQEVMTVRPRTTLPRTRTEASK